MFFFSWFKWLLMKSVEQKNYIFLTSSKIELCSYKCVHALSRNYIFKLRNWLYSDRGKRGLRLWKSIIGELSDPPMCETMKE